MTRANQHTQGCPVGPPRPPKRFKIRANDLALRATGRASQRADIAEQRARVEERTKNRAPPQA